MAVAIVVSCDMPLCHDQINLGHVTWTYAFGRLDDHGWRTWDGSVYCPACAALTIPRAKEPAR